MKVITREASEAFRDGRNFKRSNTQVIVSDTCVRLYLFGNLIAEQALTGERLLFISDAGWQSVTTKERLNGLLQVMGCEGCYIYQKDWTWHLVTGDGKKVLEPGEWSALAGNCFARCAA